MKKIRMWALDQPSMFVDASLVMVGASGTVEYPNACYLIEHPRGLVLFDTGLDPLAQTDPYAVYGEQANNFTLRFSPEQQLQYQIEALGYSLADVGYVILSHGHFDHTGGLHLFPQAEFYVGKGELPYSFWPNKAAQNIFHRPSLDRTREFNWNEVGLDHDLFGDGAITLLWLPGHTPGNLGLLVRLASQNFLLTADTVHSQEALCGIQMGSDYDTRMAVESIARVRMLSTQHNARIWITHDPTHGAEFQRAPHFYE